MDSMLNCLIAVQSNFCGKHLIEWRWPNESEWSFFLGDNTKWKMMIVPSRSSNQTTESTLAIICVIKRSKNRDLISREVNTCFKSSFMVDYNRHLKFSKLQKKKLNGFVVYWSCLPFFFPRHSTFCGLWQLLMLNGTAIDKWNWRNKKIN